MNRRILLLNHFVPPDLAPTACLLGDLSNAIRARGWEAVLVGANQAAYQGKPKPRPARWKRDAAAHLRLLWRAARAGRADAILCLTDPPALLWTASVLARWKKARLIHWAMDLYPDVAVALGEISAEGRVARAVRQRMATAWKRSHLTVALDEDMAARIPVPTEIQTPWPPSLPASSPRVPVERPPTVLYSGNLGRAHEWKTLVDAARILHGRGSPARIAFQGGGNGYEAAQKAARDLPHVIFRPYVSESELPHTLLEADALAVTQRPETMGMLWPSKLALARLTGQPILFIGATDSALARSLQGHGVFSLGQSEAVANWIERLQRGPHPPDYAKLRAEVDKVREQGLKRWIAWLE